MTIIADGNAALHIGPLVPYDLQEEIASAADIVRFHTMVPFPRLAATYQIAAFCDDAGIPGAFVECGVWKGGCSGLMALANRRHGAGSARHLYLFDSFDDMCAPDEAIDGERAVEEARAFAGVVGPLRGELAPLPDFYAQMGGHGTVEACEELLLGRIDHPADRLHVVKGWFQDTLPSWRAEIGPIALLRLDADYYAGTRFCLEQLFAQVVTGGFVVFDDYGTYEGCRYAVEEFHATLGYKMFLHHVDAEGRYWIKHR